MQTAAYLVKEQRKTLALVNDEKQRAACANSISRLTTESQVKFSQAASLPQQRALNPFIKQIGETEVVVIGPLCRKGIVGYDFSGLEKDLVAKIITSSQMLGEHGGGNTEREDMEERSLHDIEKNIQEIEEMGVTLEELWTSLQLDQERLETCAAKIVKVP